MRKLYFLLLFFLMVISGNAQTVTVGSGTMTTGQSPWESSSGYSYVQTIYLGSEINASGTITAIRYYYAGTSLSSNQAIKVYMKTVSRTAFGSDTDWEPVSGMTLVFDGIVGNPAMPGWITITLTTPFAYKSTTGNLLIAVDENTPGNNGSTRFHSTTSNPANRVLYFRTDAASNNPDPTTPPAGTRSSDVGNIQIEGLTLGCQQPTGLTTGTVTPATVGFSWTAPLTGPTPAGYNYEIRTSGNPGNGANGLAASGSTTTTSAVATGLVPGTLYSIYVRADCGNGNFSNWTPAATATTICTVLTTPTASIETFDTYLPTTCWSEAAGLLTASTSFTSTTTSLWTFGNFANSLSATNQSAKINIYGTGTRDWIITPSYDLGTSANKQLEFDLALTEWNGTSATTLGSDDKFVVLISTDNGLTWSTSNILRSWNSTTPISRTGEHVVINLSAYTGIVKFAFYAESIISNADNDLFVDNFAVNVIPACSAPTSFLVSGITTTGASVTWTAPSVPPVSYDVYYNTTNTAPTAATTPTASGVTAPYSLTGLAASTTYYVWVRSNCATSGISAWSPVPLIFTTLCTPLSTFTQNFDALTPPALPDCWYKVGAGGAINTQAGDFSSSPNSLYVYSSSTTSIGLVSMPRVNNLGAGTHRLRFSMRANFTLNGVVAVGYLTNPNDPATFTLLQSFTASSFSYVSYTVTPPAGISAEVLAFRHSGSPANSVLIDDVSWEPIQNCLAPTALTITGITTSGASVNWTAPVNPPASYDVYYSTSGTAPTSATSPSASGVTAPYSLTGLDASTTYYVWVRSNCGGSGLSAWSAVKSFMTACGPVTLPYVVNFNAETVPGLPNCTAVQDVNNDGNTWKTIEAPAGYTGNVVYYPYNSSTGANDWFYTAGLNLTAGKSYVLAYRYGNNATGYTEKLKIALGTTATAASMTTVLADYPSVNDNTPRTHAIRFTVPANGVYYIGFQAYSAANQWNLYLDDISVTEANVAPTSVNTCVTVLAPPIDAQNNTKWMALRDVNGNIVGEINGNGNNLGDVSVKVYRNSGSIRKDAYGHYYLDRNIEITPTTQPLTPVSVRLYFSAAELTALQLQSGSNVNSYTDISVFKNNDVCGSTVIGGAVKINTVTAIYGSDYVANFDVNRFSSFYLAASAYTVLPANIISFSGLRQANSNKLQWIVAQEADVVEYEVERSTDGGSFWTKIGSVGSLGNSTTQRIYKYSDNTFTGLKQLYRLRQVDRNGLARLSSIVSISGVKPTSLMLSGLFPNPAASKLNILVEAPQKDNLTINIFDGVGRLVKSQRAIVEAGSNTLPVNVMGLVQGAYLVKVTCDDDCNTVVGRFVKE